MPVAESAVVAAIGGLPLRGNEEGLIPAFGLYLTRHYAAYYNDVSFAYLHGCGSDSDGVASGMTPQV